jgi:hypothetical protein
MAILGVKGFWPAMFGIAESLMPGVVQVKVVMWQPAYAYAVCLSALLSLRLKRVFKMKSLQIGRREATRRGYRPYQAQAMRRSA